MELLLRKGASIKVETYTKIPHCIIVLHGVAILCSTVELLLWKGASIEAMNKDNRDILLGMSKGP